MFLCRVMIGEFCLGESNSKKPILFDSTVDNVADPSIFVTYHDAQAYPEYLVRFRH